MNELQRGVQGTQVYHLLCAVADSQFKNLARAVRGVPRRVNCCCQHADTLRLPACPCCCAVAMQWAMRRLL